MEYPSKTIELAVQQLSTLPGIGKKTALRLALHLLKRSAEEVDLLGNSLIHLKKNTKFCKHCNNITDADECGICLNPRRNTRLVCVVEESKDVIALEKTGQYDGLYHVLGGLINPLEGITPSRLKLQNLIQKLQNSLVDEVVIALSGSPEGEITSMYLIREIKNYPVVISSIARGIPVGSDLEYADEITLAKSLLNRTVVQP